jgi:polar amino acid transport system substrate-binding protein
VIWKKLAVTAALLAMTVCAAMAQTANGYWQEIQQRGVLRCGAAISAPYVMRDPQTGDFSGTFVDMCRQFGEKVLNVKVEIVPTTWDDIVAGLQAGRWDIAMSLNRTPTRALAITFTEPAAYDEVSLLYDKGNPKFKTPPTSFSQVDSAGINIAVVSGTAEDHAITPLTKSANIIRLPDDDAARLALSSHRADVLVDNSVTNALFAATAPDRWVNMLPTPAVAKQGIAFGLRRTASMADVDVFNILIEDLVATGQLASMEKSYIDKLVPGAK